MILNTIIALRRDNDYNYAKIKDRFIPQKGELCLVDTARDGLRVICGDGVTPFGELDYTFETLVQGYYKDGKFFKEIELLNDIPGQVNKIYIDKTSGKSGLYYFDGINFCQISGVAGSIPNATANTPGIMKLYDSLGSNTDGTMTQKAITDELNEKVEVEINKEEELLVFSY